MSSYARYHLKRIPKQRSRRADAATAYERAEAALTRINGRGAHRIPDSWDDIPRARQPTNKGKKSRQAKLQRSRRGR